jgi:hypothetical protein
VISIGWIVAVVIVLWAFSLWAWYCHCFFFFHRWQKNRSLTDICLRCGALRFK